MPNPVAEASVDTFVQLGLDRFGNLNLVATEINGASCDLISVMEIDDEGTHFVTPIAILVNPDIFPMLVPPVEDEDDE